MSRSASLQHEEAFPLHRTVILALSAPDMTHHYPSERCAIECPHKISKCGEFAERPQTPDAESDGRVVNAANPTSDKESESV